MARSKKIRDSKTALKAFQLANSVKNKARYNENKFGVSALSDVKWLTKKNIRALGYQGQRKLIKEMEAYTYRYNEETNFRKNDQGVVYNLGTYRKVQKLNRVTKQKAIKERKMNEKTPFIALGGQDTGKTVAEKNKDLAESETKSIFDIPDIDLDKVKDERELNKRIEKREKIVDDEYMRMRKLQYKINFIAMTHRSLNSYGDEVVRLMEMIPEDDFFELARQFEEFQFIDPSDPLADEIAEAKAEGMMAILNTYFAGNVDMSLKFID